MPTFTTTISIEVDVTYHINEEGMIEVTKCICAPWSADLWNQLDRDRQQEIESCAVHDEWLERRR